MNWFQGEEVKPNPNLKENEEFRKDLIASAALGPCRNIARELLRVRAFESSMKVYSQVEGKFVDCINNFAQQYDAWSSASDENQRLYYFDRRTRKSQWDRPEELEQIIQDAKNNKFHDPSQPWLDCEFLHVRFLQCEKTSEVERTGCQNEFEGIRSCVEKKLGGMAPATKSNKK